MFVAVFATVVAGLFLLAPRDLDALARSAASAILSISNFYFWKTTGYFGTTAELKPLLHTWSLAVEEQFYLLLPAAMVLVCAFARRWLKPLLLLAFVVSLALSEYVVQRSANTAYFLLPTRAFELLAGSILAVFRLHLPDARVGLRNAAMVAGLAMIAVPALTFSEATVFPGVNALWPTLGAALVLLAGTGATPILAARLISTAGFRFFGDISYSLYLWHWPIMALLRNVLGHDLAPAVAWGAVAASVAAAALSYRFVEQPFMRARTTDLPFLRLGGAAMAASLLLLAPLVATGGLPGRFPPASQALFAAAEDHNPQRDACHNDSGDARPYAQNCIFGTQGDGRLLAVWGDSHGAELAFALGRQSSALGMNVMEITASSCPPALDFVPLQRPNCVAHNRETLAGIAADARVGTVVLAANAAGYDDGRAALASGLEAVVKTLRAAGKAVILVEQIPLFESDPPVTLGFAAVWDEDLSRFGLPLAGYTDLAGTWNADLKRLARTYGAVLVASEALLCDTSVCRMYSRRGGVLYFDSVHLSLSGARLLATAIVPVATGRVPPTPPGTDPVTVPLRTAQRAVP